MPPNADRMSFRGEFSQNSDLLEFQCFDQLAGGLRWERRLTAQTKDCNLSSKRVDKPIQRYYESTIIAPREGN